MKTRLFLGLALLTTIAVTPNARASEEVGMTQSAEEFEALMNGSEDSLTVSRIARYGLSCIYNNFSFPLNYQVKWGDGQWKNMSVAANSWRSHYFTYATTGQPTSSKLYVRFDSDLQGGLSWVSYLLTKYQAEDTDCNRMGKKYRFEYDNSSRYIDLRSFN